MRYLTHTLRAALLLIGTVVMAVAGVADDDSSRREDQLKAAYLFNFVKFVEWPATIGIEVIEICFLGAQGVHDSLAIATADKRVGARSVAVRMLSPGDPPGQCDLIYFDASVSASSQPLFSAARATALTVSDEKGFTRNGGAIQLFTEDNRLRFVVNVENARRAGLRISSNLLKLATNVEKEAAP